jgi:hypothetical protein
MLAKGDGNRVVLRYFFKNQVAECQNFDRVSSLAIITKN